MHTALTPTYFVRRVVVATFLFLSFATVLAQQAPANAAHTTTGEQTVLPIVLRSRPNGPVLPDGRLVVRVPVVAVADRELLADLDSGARIDRLSAGQPAPQAGPYHDSTTWSWEICFWVTFPDGTSYEWCFELTITVSTDVDAPAHPSGPIVLASNSNGVPLKLCWEETRDDGTVVKRCIEITIETGGGRQD